VQSYCSEYARPIEDKSDDVKDRFYKQLERVIDQFPMNDMKIFLGDRNAKLCGKIFSNRQLGTRVHTKLLMTMGLE
jgi:hypothetical protein